MKTYCVLLLCCLFVASTGLGEGVLRTFTTLDGKSLNAVIKDYNGSNGKIQFEREDGKEVWTSPSVFSEPDQEYIQQWITANQFMSPAKFKIKADSTKNKISEEKTEIAYEITLENKTDFPVEDLKIEYRAFILNKGYGSQKDSNRLDGGELHIAGIPAGEKAIQTTQPINLTTSSSSCCGKRGQEKLEGFWLTVSGPEIDGKPVIREWCNPSNSREEFIQYLEACGTSNDAKKLLDAVRGLWRFAPEQALELAMKAYIISQSRDAARTVGELYLFHLKPVNIPFGLEWLEKAAKKNDHEACWKLAEFYATCTDPQHHDAEKGIEYGLQAISLEPDDYRGNYYLAVAYAHDGQFEKAVEHQELVVNTHKEYCKISETFRPYLSKMEETLKLYRNRKTR
ncbi:MAG: hypothetical protein DRP64_03005 [Verrucomicrobia bacterium]|nr:MAG: hypothetical protein DRP64_03005 [Verrucomicrobiota bacterium]